MNHKLKIISVISIIFSSAFLFAHFALSQENPEVDLQPTIENVVSSPGKFHGTKITVEGKVSRVKFARSLSGKPYTLFKLVDSVKNTINVYTKGHLDIEKGNRLRIYGKFKKENRYLLFEFKNVVKAKLVEIIG